jgi:hypothetical protein
MSALSEAINAIRDAITLADDVKRLGGTLKEAAHELRDHDRRITRLEAKWEAAVELSVTRVRPPRRIGDGD